MKRPKMTEYGEPTGFGVLVLLVGFILISAFIISLTFGEDTQSRTDIPGTNCEVVEKHINNIWFTPGENKTVSKVVCTTEIEKVDIGR